MEEVFLWSDACQETSLHKSPSSGAGVVSLEGGKETAAGHERWSLALQLNLAQETGYLHTVHLWGEEGAKEAGHTDIMAFTVLPLAPDCTIICRLLVGNGLCSPAGTQALSVRRTGTSPGHQSLYSTHVLMRLLNSLVARPIQ